MNRRHDREAMLNCIDFVFQFLLIESTLILVPTILLLMTPLLSASKYLGSGAPLRFLFSGQRFGAVKPLS